MASFVSMVDEIKDDFIDESISTQSVKDAINRSIKHYERRHFWFNEIIGSFETIPYKEYYGATDLADIPNMAEIMTVVGFPTSGQYVEDDYWEDDYVESAGATSLPMAAVGWKEIEQVQNGETLGFPTKFAYFNNEIRLYPAPDSIYTFRVAFVKRFPELANDDDENPWTTEAYELIKQSAKRRLALNKLHAPDLGEIAGGQEMEAFDELLAETRRRRPAKKLRTPDISATGGFDIQRGF